MKEKKLSQADVGFIDDAVISLMSHEHCYLHAIKTYFETNDDKWLRIAHEHRIDRSNLQETCGFKGVGESWCYFKHSFDLIMSSLELGNRKYTEGKKVEAKKYYAIAKKYWLLVKELNQEGGKNGMEV